MKKTLLALSLLPLNLMAQVTLNTFTSGTPISASSVNANFTAIKTKLDAYDASNADLYTFPGSYGSNGQVLTSNGSGGMSWTTPGGGGLTFTTPGTTGTAPGWSVAGSVYNLNIPLASSPGVTAGLISKTDYDFFTNKLSTPSGSNGQVLMFNGSSWVGSNVIGPTSAASFGIRTNGIERFTVNSSGHIGVGTNSPSSAFDLVVSNLTGANGIYLNPTLTGTSTHQVGLNVSPTINQAGATGYTGLLINVSETSGGTDKILLDMKHAGSPKFTVNHQGYITTSGAFMGAISLSTGCSTSQSTITFTNPSFSSDFGTISSPFSLSGLQEIILDMPATVGSGTITQLDFYLDNGGYQAKLVQGRNVKRLPSGSYSLKANVICSASTMISFSSLYTVFGIRRFH